MAVYLGPASLLAAEGLTPRPEVVYDARMALEAASVASARALLVKYGTWLRKYHGGMPVGFLAAIMDHESGGRFGTPGDASLGEVGFFQVAAYVPPLFGMPASARTDPETNIAIAVLEYSLEAALMKIKYPTYVELGTADSWMLARLAFAIGRGGAQSLANAAIAKGLASSGKLYPAIQQYVATHGAPSLGSQSPSKVAQRVASIPVQWMIGQALAADAPGPPQKIPQPPAAHYAIPSGVAHYFSSPFPIAITAIGVATVVAYYLWSR